MAHCEKEKIDALILSLDFEKCFDYISFTAISGAMAYFGYGEYLINWTDILYNGFTVMIQNNGNFTNKIPVQRGVHQGGPASVYYFLNCAEILALNIKANPDIQGIPIKQMLNLLSQYADDADVFMLNKEKSLKELLKELQLFYKHAGFKVNYNKTTILRIGSLRHSEAKLQTQEELTWTNESINVLGIWVTHHEQRTLEMNYEKTIQKGSEIMKSWMRRKLSLIGKINIINTLVASLFVYKMMSLPSIPKYMVKKIEREMRHFLWNGASPKIGTKTLRANKIKGGLKLVDLEIRDIALKVTWIQILKQDNEMAIIAYNNLQIEIGEEIWKANISPQDVRKTFTKGFLERRTLCLELICIR